MMQEKLVLDYLKKELEVPVYMEVPKKASNSFVVVEKLGSSYSNRIQSGTFAIQSYGPSLYEAADLNDRVIRAMNKMDRLDSVSFAALTSDYNHTDTETKTYRYQAVYDLVFFM